MTPPTALPFPPEIRSGRSRACRPGIGPLAACAAALLLATQAGAQNAGAPQAVEESAAAEQAAGLEIVISGVRGEPADNVRNSLGGNWAAVTRRESNRARNRFLREAETQAAIALRPYGYYQAQVTAQVEGGAGDARLLLAIEPGPPVKVGTVNIRIEGEGAGLDTLSAWRKEWPLPSGAVLNQPRWERHKQDVLDRAAEWGYLNASFAEQRIALDLERQVADLTLVLHTGQRAVFGSIRFEQDFLDEAVLRPVARFSEGEPYRAWVMDRLRTDLWKLGYFQAIDVNESRRLDADPPVVDVVVRLEQTNRGTHQGTLGYGTDTEFRTQYRWQRHQLSERGDSLTSGLAWQTRDEELLVYGEYRLPRRTSTSQYWLLSPSYSDRDQRIELDVEGREETLPIADGRVENLFVRGGRVRLRNAAQGREQVIETLYAEYLWEENQIETSFILSTPLQNTTQVITAQTRSQTLAFGIEYDWPNFRGSGFGLEGHRERANLFTANEAWGSDRDFTQLYLSSRWNILLGDRWKLLLRGELGYTDADVDALSVDDGVDVFSVSLTALPFRYRFFAGGSHSVRGYDFESLSNNGIGSNHLVTASAEFEYQLREQWSVAAFLDTGNAFNDWGDARLKTGVGVGVRWYNFGFPVRLDLAQALDLEGEPWRIHFTIGSPLF